MRNFINCFVVLMSLACPSLIHGQATIVNSISLNSMGQVVDKNGTVIPNLRTVGDGGFDGAYIYAFYYNGNFLNVIKSPSPPLLTATTGSTTLIRLSSYDNTSQELTSLFALSSTISTPGVPLVTFMRDATGHYWIGKQLDDASDMQGGANASNAYLFRLWDPVSPCATQAGSCQTDDIFVNIMPNGQVLLHEIAVLANGQISWQAGMTNFALPVAHFQPNAMNPSQGNAPPLHQNFTVPNAVTLLNPNQYYGSPTNYGIPLFGDQWVSYPIIDLLTEWSGNLFTSSDLSGLITFWNTNLSAANGPKLQSSDVPCNSGRFQKNGEKDNPVITTQYAPRPPFVSSPCSQN